MHATGQLMHEHGLARAGYGQGYGRGQGMCNGQWMGNEQQMMVAQMAWGGGTLGANEACRGRRPICPSDDLQARGSPTHLGGDQSTTAASVRIARDARCMAAPI